MIDEDLYQQAADELNSDRRKPELWERAQRLAGNDHDEARFLYTNLRVEELLAEREKTIQSSPDDTLGNMNDSLSLAPLDSTGTLDEGTASADGTGAGAAESIGSPFSAELDDIEDDALDQTISSPPGAYNTAADPDADLLSDYVSDGAKGLDDTYSGDAFSEDELASELEIFNEEHSDVTHVEGESVEDSFFGQSPLDQSQADGSPLNQSQLDGSSLNQSHLDGSPLDQSQLDGSSLDQSQLDGSPLEQSARNQPVLDQSQLDGSFLNPPALDQSFLDESPVLDDANLTASFEAMVGGVHGGKSQGQQVDIGTLDEEHAAVPQASDTTADELDMMLDDVDYKPDDKSSVENPLHWLDEEDTPRIAAQLLNKDVPEPVVIDNDPLSNELSRQANEMDLGEEYDQTAYIADDTDDAFIGENPSQVVAHYSDETASADGLGYGTAATGNLAVQSDSSRAQSAAHHGSSTSYDHTADQRDFPLDLTHGRKGAEYSIYRRNNSAQAVKNSVSWSALFLTLPYLVYRHLFGTALAYVILWIVAVGGLTLSALAWIDAGVQVTPLVQACTIGFALLCFIGMIYLPFRYGNIWRGERLEHRGFDLVATTRAKNPGRAISRARRHAALD